jgi:hypothetical protein
VTAEAIVMNRWAVAMAADSAVTIDSSTAGPKIYNSANKLFELIRGSNVGVMVYNAAEINSTPWETVIKAYRVDNPNFSAASVTEYADHFLQFVSRHEDLLQPADEHVAAIGIAWNQISGWVLDELLNWPEQLQSDTGEVIQPNMRDALDEIIACWEYELESADDADISRSTRRAIKAQFYAPILVFTEEFLSVKAIPATAEQVKMIAELAFISLTKHIQDPGGTGLVFAGFGAEEYFPSMVSTQITARFCGEVLRYETARAEISAAVRGHWETFAQDGPAQGWANGIHDIVRNAVMDEWGVWVTETLTDEVEKVLRDSGLSEEEAADAADVISGIAENQLGEFGEYMNDLEELHFRGPMKASIEVLPKDELALLAESLVNLTSLRQRMSVDEQNTVGGPIDVAVISPGDGFVWLKRKHYFQADLNPTWHLTHGATIRTDPQQGRNSP